LTNTKFNARLQNKYLIESFQQAYFITILTKSNPTYNDVRNTLLTFNETIDEYENESKQSLSELIQRINGTN